MQEASVLALGVLAQSPKLTEAGLHPLYDTATPNTRPNVEHTWSSRYAIELPFPVL